VDKHECSYLELAPERLATLLRQEIVYGEERFLCTQKAEEKICPA